MRCPHCRHVGTFEALPSMYDLSVVGVGFLGQRRCPNPECRGHIFFAVDQRRRLLESYPPERIDFNATDIPPSILKAFEEAITCHANGCYAASAIMVRKTLEELCRDRGATGATLKARIESLRTLIVLPQELIDGLDDIRLLGNDAAHVDAQIYDQIGKDEVEIGIEFTKEVLKAVYQYSALLNRLRSLKK